MAETRQAHQAQGEGSRDTRDTSPGAAATPPFPQPPRVFIFASAPLFSFTFLFAGGWDSLGSEHSGQPQVTGWLSRQPPRAGGRAVAPSGCAARWPPPRSPSSMEVASCARPLRGGRWWRLKGRSLSRPKVSASGPTPTPVGPTHLRGPAAGQQSRPLMGNTRLRLQFSLALRADAVHLRARSFSRALV